MSAERVTAGRPHVVDRPLPRYVGTFTAYLANPDGSATCVGVECGHHHSDYNAAVECGYRLARRVERRPEAVPEVAAELARRRLARLEADNAARDARDAAAYAVERRCAHGFIVDDAAECPDEAGR